MDFFHEISQRGEEERCWLYGPSGEGREGCTLLFTNWFRRFLVRHSLFGWTSFIAFCSVFIRAEWHPASSLMSRPPRNRVSLRKDSLFVCVYVLCVRGWHRDEVGVCVYVCTCLCVDACCLAWSLLLYLCLVSLSKETSCYGNKLRMCGRDPSHGMMVATVWLIFFIC